MKTSSRLRPLLLTVACGAWCIGLVVLLIQSLHSGAFQSMEGQPLGARIDLARERLAIQTVGTWLGIIGFVVFGVVAIEPARLSASTLSRGQLVILWLATIGTLVLGGWAIWTDTLPYPLTWVQLKPALRAVASSLAGVAVFFIVGTSWWRLAPTPP